jgi:hypothetical protein
MFGNSAIATDTNPNGLNAVSDERSRTQRSRDPDLRVCGCAHYARIAGAPQPKAALITSTPYELLKSR